jgi:hypothetical protein
VRNEAPWQAVLAGHERKVAMDKEFSSPATLPPPVGYSHIAKVTGVLLDEGNTQLRTPSDRRTEQQGARPPLLATSNTYKFNERPLVLLQKRTGLFFWIIGPVAIPQFAFGFMPELILTAFGPAGGFPQLVGAVADLLIVRTGHFSLPDRFGTDDNIGLPCEFP